jgi:hypothetical protein
MTLISQRYQRLYCRLQLSLDFYPIIDFLSEHSIQLELSDHIMEVLYRLEIF